MRKRLDDTGAYELLLAKSRELAAVHGRVPEFRARVAALEAGLPVEVSGWQIGRRSRSPTNVLWSACPV